MEGLYQNKFKIKSFRLENYDYSQVGYYFVTICAHDRKMFFGKIKDGKMLLNRIGKTADIYLCSLADHFLNAHTDKYVVMPNHIHAIMVIEESRDTPRRVSTEAYTAKFGNMISGSLSSIVKHYKGSVKKWCNKNGYEYFQWQTGYYDHIIRREKDYGDIWEYIDLNPDKWEWDRNNPKNLKL